MIRCKTCKHFILGFNPGKGKCFRADGRKGKPLHKDTLAYAHDGEDVFAVLRVSEDFGCVMWEEKDGRK